MIIGSGLLAQGFAQVLSLSQNVCIYAAGVSNSNCIDSFEFERECQRLTDALEHAVHVDAFVYFGTCSVADPEAINTPYVQHKLAMERIVQNHPKNMILRLPQVAGKTPNPHTLLNFLYGRISRSERFNLWSKAKRNIIDVADVVVIVQQLIANNATRNVTLNIANAINYSMLDIVDTMEQIVGKTAVFNKVERGSDYFIDITSITPMLENAGIKFDDNYLQKVIKKYYT